MSEIEKKGRTMSELTKVISWLMEFNESNIQALIDEKATFKTFFVWAMLHPNAPLITGTICGYRVEEIENATTRNVRYLDKLVDELARGQRWRRFWGREFEASL